MCMVFDNLSTLWPKRHPRFFYKVYAKVNGRLVSPVRRFTGSVIEEPGEVVSNRKDLELDHEERMFYEVHKGIHVFLEKKDAETYKRTSQAIDFQSRQLVVVKVSALKRDLVKYGGTQAVIDGRYFKSAVFLKVKISKKEWKRVMANVSND